MLPCFNDSKVTKREECLIINLFTEILKLYISQLEHFDDFFKKFNFTQVAVLFSTLFRFFF